MIKKVRAASFAASLLFVITGFFAWRFDQTTQASLSGWQFLFNEPIVFLLVILVLAGTFSFIFLRHKRYGIFTIVLGLIAFYALIEQMIRTLRLTQQNFFQLYQSGFLISLILLGLIILLSIVQLILIKKEN